MSGLLCRWVAGGLEGGQQSLVYLKRHSRVGSARGNSETLLFRMFCLRLHLLVGFAPLFLFPPFSFRSRAEESNLEKVGQPLLPETTFSLITKDNPPPICDDPSQKWRQWNYLLLIKSKRAFLAEQFGLKFIITFGNLSPGPYSKVRESLRNT